MNDSENLMIEVLQDFLNGEENDVDFEVININGREQQYVSDIYNLEIFTKTQVSDDSFTFFKINPKNVEWDVYKYTSYSSPAIRITSKITPIISRNVRHTNKDLESSYIIFSIIKTHADNSFLPHTTITRKGETFLAVCSLYYNILPCEKEGRKIPSRDEEGNIILPLPGTLTKSVK